MLERVDLESNLSVEAYDAVFPGLEIRLGECQRAARTAGLPVILVFEGWDAAGKGTLINRLTQALDPRGFRVQSIHPPTEEERRRPWLWRFWMRLPAAGGIAIFDHSWYGRVLRERLEHGLERSRLRRAYRDIRIFERQLTDSGALLVKFWLHISRAEQRRRFKRLKDNPATAWKVGQAEKAQQRHYAQWLAAVEETLQRSSAPRARWTVIAATHGRRARVQAFQTVIRAMEQALARRRQAAEAPVRTAPPAPVVRRTLAERVDLSLSLPREVYERQLKKWQRKLFDLEHEIYRARIPVVIVYEGTDAAGKGGNIRRLTQGLDPRGYEVIPVGAPSAEEQAQHYLWRFWRHVPKTGHIAIFDRSWYGRVLVERVEGFCRVAEWRRAYREINEFERQMRDAGAVIVKFYLVIDRREQLRRFRQREATAYKAWKITAEDWRNRRRWREYEAAVAEMLRRTSTARAPWTVLEANCKLHARIKALRTVAEALQDALRRRR